MVHLSLSAAGIDRIDSTVEEAGAQPTADRLGQAAAGGASRVIGSPFSEIREAIDEFRERFFLPLGPGGWRCWSNTAREPERRGIPRDILTIFDAMQSSPCQTSDGERSLFYRPPIPLCTRSSTR